jgi:hypothetical protein
VGISFGEAADLYRAIAAKAEGAARPVADAIAATYEDHLVNVTLVESGAHGPATPAGYPPAAAPGRPPMVMTGSLRASVLRTPAVGGGGVATASVAPHTVYAATQEFGAVHTGSPHMWLWVRYVGPKVTAHRNWVKSAVVIKEHPYMRAAVTETFASGALSRAAVRSFMAEVWG